MRESTHSAAAAGPVSEPLTASADLFADVATSLCVGGWSGSSSCAWYHGTWQYLRLVDLVPTPAWHREFYAAQLHRALSADGCARVLVSGAADYAMYAQLLAAGADVDGLAVSVADTCPTALFASSWYAHRSGRTIDPVAGDVRHLSRHAAGAYDLICADAFLTRFGPGSVDEVLCAWAALLRPGGLVVTTVRVDFPFDLRDDVDAARRFSELAVRRWERSVRGVRPTAAEIGDRAAEYARRMTSYPLGTEAEVLAMLSYRFGVAYFDTKLVHGSLQPVRYLRVVLRKATG